MAKNILFNYIEHYLANHNIAFANCQSLKKDSNIEDHDYYRFELKNNKPTSLKDEQHTYQLLNHHISVYQIEKRSKAVLSQYHYTAYFVDEEGTEYQLHAYYNDKNKLTTAPIFSVRQDNGDYIKVASEHLESEFIILASTNSDPVIEDVKKRLTKEVQTQEKNYKKLEASASQLSVSIKDNYTAYIQTLGDMAATARRLTPLVNHNFYQSVSSLTIRMQRALIEQHKKQTKKTTTAPSSSSKPSQKPNKEKDEENTVSSPQRKATQKKGDSTSMLEAEITKLDKQLKSLHSEEQETLVTRLGDLIAQLHGLSLLLEDKTNTASLQSLQTLHKVHHQLYEKGENLFHSLLLSSQFELAARLPAFYYLLNGYLEEALETRNHHLLSFILKYGDFSINNQAVNVKGKSYPSAVQCCFSLDSKTTPMDECLAALIAQGASITSGNGNSLPIAYTILATPNHPLRKALVANNETTLMSLQFYKQLITSVNLYLDKNRVQLKKRQGIEDQLASYQTAIKKIAGTVIPMNAQEKSLQMQSMKFEAKYDNEINRKLTRDPEVAKLMETFYATQKRLIKKLSPIARREYNSSRADFLNNQDKIIEESGLATNFEVRKKAVLRNFHDMLSLVEKQLALVTIKQEMNRFRQGPRFIQLLKQYEILHSEVVELERLQGVGIPPEKPKTVDEADKKVAAAKGPLTGSQTPAEDAKTPLASAKKRSEEGKKQSEEREQQPKQLTQDSRGKKSFGFFPNAPEKEEEEVISPATDTDLPSHGA